MEWIAAPADMLSNPSEIQLDRERDKESEREKRIPKKKEASTEMYNRTKRKRSKKSLDTMAVIKKSTWLLDSSFGWLCDKHS